MNNKSIKNDELRITDKGLYRNSKLVIRNSNIPDLRFPEFKNEGEWEVKTIENVFRSNYYEHKIGRSPIIFVAENMLIDKRGVALTS